MRGLVPLAKGKSRYLNATGRLKKRIVSAVTPRTAMVVRPAVMMRVSLNRARRLQNGEVREKQQNEQ